MCDTSLFHFCTDLGLGEVVIESNKAIFLFFVSLYYLFADLHKATQSQTFQPLSFGNLHI